MIYITPFNIIPYMYIHIHTRIYTYIYIYIHMIIYIYICTIFIIWVKLVKYQIVPKLDRFTEVIQLYASSKAECEQQGFEPHLDLAILTLRSDVGSNENIRKPCQSLAGKTREKCKVLLHSVYSNPKWSCWKLGNSVKSCSYGAVILHSSGSFAKMVLS